MSDGSWDVVAFEDHDGGAEQSPQPAKPASKRTPRRAKPAAPKTEMPVSLGLNLPTEFISAMWGYGEQVLRLAKAVEESTKAVTAGQAHMESQMEALANAMTEGFTALSGDLAALAEGNKQTIDEMVRGTLGTAHNMAKEVREQADEIRKLAEAISAPSTRPPMPR